MAVARNGSKKTGMDRKILNTTAWPTIATLGCAVFVVSFPFAYAYYLTDGSVLPVAFLHSIWNILDPWILGDIYGNVQALVAAGGFVLLLRRGYRIPDS
jgi:hypothetical protein